MLIHTSTCTVLKNLVKKKPDKECFYSSVKDGTTGDNGKKLDGPISKEDYLTCKKFGMNLTLKIWVIITIII